MTKEKGILTALAQGDESVFKQLYIDHFNMIKYLIINNSGSEEQASDIFQETIIVLFEKARDGKLELKASLKTIIYSISRNLWLKQLRDTKSKNSINDFEEHIHSKDYNSINEDEYDKQLSILSKCLNELGNPCKELLTQFYYFKKSLQELADMFDYNNTNTVKTQKYKCLKRLRKMAINMI